MPIYDKRMQREIARQQRMPRPEAGVRVAYSRKYLRSIGDFTWAAAALRGTITKHAEPGPFVWVRWDTGLEPRLCHAGNLVREDRLHLEAA